MVVWWLCWHRTILIRNITQKQYSQFPPVHDFRKPWWGVAYVPCMTNLRALYAWVIRWHVTCMLSLAEHWQGRRALSNHVCAHSVISMWNVVCLQHLAVSNLGQPLFCLSFTWSRCRNAYRDLWIMTIAFWLRKGHSAGKPLPQLAIREDAKFFVQNWTKKVIICQ